MSSFPWRVNLVFVLDQIVNRYMEQISYREEKSYRRDFFPDSISLMYP